jgi:hypothetical protein
VINKQVHTTTKLEQYILKFECVSAVSMLVRPIEKTKQMWKNAGEREKVQEYGLWVINWRAGLSLVVFVYDGCMWPIWLSRNASYWKRTAKPWDVLFTWLITCAVYLEFVDTFSSDDSLLIFHRIMGFYSSPHIFQTDNDTSLASSKESWRWRCSIKTRQRYILSIGKEWRGSSSSLECLVSKERTKRLSLWPNGLCMRRYVKKIKKPTTTNEGAIPHCSLRACGSVKQEASYRGRKT